MWTLGAGQFFSLSKHATLCRRNIVAALLILVIPLSGFQISIEDGINLEESSPLSLDKVVVQDTGVHDNKGIDDACSPLPIADYVKEGG